MEEVTNEASPLHTYFSKESLGPWANGRGEEINSGNGKSGEVAHWNSFSLGLLSFRCCCPSDRLTAGV